MTTESTPICISCGLPRDEHVLKVWCPDALEEEATFQDRDDPALLINVFAREEAGRD
jgi:hypothetical protein